jgi:hypothetical protein
MIKKAKALTVPAEPINSLRFSGHYDLAFKGFTFCRPRFRARTISLICVNFTRSPLNHDENKQEIQNHNMSAMAPAPARPSSTEASSLPGKSLVQITSITSTN